MTDHHQPTGAAVRRPVAVHTAARPRLSLAEHGPQHVFTSLTDNAGLIVQLARREIAARYRGSVLGVAWSFVTPMLMLAIYTFVFSVVFQTRWATPMNSRFEFALVLFAGLIVFALFSECVSRAPSLMAENPSYIKRIVFPLEALAWVSLASALFNAAVSFGILLVAYVLIAGLPPLTVLWLPVVLMPLVLMTLGLVWFLSSTGLFIRDIRQFVGIVVPVLMFASPLFYPVSALPERVRGYMQINPLAVAMEQVRDVLLFAKAPGLGVLALSLVLSMAVAWAGVVWFRVTKRGFADVV
ncbi:ABC transporter permease [Candidatus Thiodictyon syntrophicum]|jgi:lipopolysaccharide transport system permease protein|uniref:Transport permease protein n=1 Tax=Candidatus Thiodictyon syntrophicum TaxID=1166950 RepID=A0A2K8UG64_9GAMM|nr:ABC transporter permease [Candidatus Thiodictyon syntrophicum]AUB84545.1 sugar ABC transporter permease [Candidatus Thiodictyon syntrophicum]